MHLTTEERQRETDDNWKRLEQRESDARFACPDYTLPPRLPQPTSFEKLTNFSDLLAHWEEEDRKKKQIERDELKAFNLKYGYQP